MVQPNFRVKKGHIKIGCHVSIIIQLKEERDEYEEVVYQPKGHPFHGGIYLSLSGRSTPADRSCGIFAPPSTIP